MLQEGFSPALIENLGRQTGMPKGSLEWADDLGLDLVMNYEKQAATHYGPKYVQHPSVVVLKEMIDGQGRFGKKKKEGFYDYDDQVRALWVDLVTCFPSEQDTETDWEELQERFLFAQVIEAIWCMQEKVITSFEAANLGSIYGWGFPAFKGGVIQYINDYGIDRFLARCKYFEGKYGQRFQAPKILSRIANQATAI